MYIGVHVKYPLFLLDFNETGIFFDLCSKSTQISNSVKIRPVGAELLHADGQTDMMKLKVAFCNFAEVAKTSSYLRISYDCNNQQFFCMRHSLWFFLVSTDYTYSL